MGIGKSTVSEKVAAKLDVDAFDLDRLIETAYGNSISTLFKEKGEIYFRQLEHKVLIDFLETHDNYVLSLGGGTPMYYNNAEITLVENSISSFYLDGHVKTIVNRLSNTPETRPLIAHLSNKDDLTDFVRKHLFERVPVYRKAKHTINVDHKSIAEVANSLLSLV